MTTPIPMSHPEVSIVMPCLNEADTLATCIDKAHRAFRDAGIEGEVVVGDNGSTDGSPAIAEAHGAQLRLDATHRPGARFVLSGLRGV